MTKYMRKVYNAMLAAAIDKTSELWLNGEPRMHGGSHRCYFWLGAGKLLHPMPPRNTSGYACYLAGKEYAKSIL